MIQRNCVVFTASVFLFLIVFSIPSLIASQENSNKPAFKSSIPQSTIQNLSSTEIVDPKLDSAAFAQKTKKLQIPFVANNGQVDAQVKYYANTFGGTVFVTKDGEIVYALPNNSSDVETQCLASSMHSPKWIRDAVGMLHDDHVSDIMHPAAWIVGRDSKSAIQNLSSTSIGDLKSGVAIKEALVGGRVQEITGNEKAVTKVSYFKGNDKSQWKTNISTYDVISLGEVYDGIELKLKAYGNNVEKLFCVKPDANPDQIKIKMSEVKNPKSESQNLSPTPIRDPKLSVNEHGELVAETELGLVKFTKPMAYQEINGKRVDVECKYTISECGMQNAECKTNLKSEIRNLSSTPIGDPQLEYGFTVASYDKTKDLIIDPLLASTFLGGNGSDYGYSIAIDSGGNIYLTGQTNSTTFPTTSGAYDNSRSDSDGDAFVSKLSNDLSSLLASTYFGGNSRDCGYSIAIETNGNVYVAGETLSADFPITAGTYDTSFNGGSNNGDVFVSKLNGDLTNLLASTYWGGDSDDSGRSIDINSAGDIYVAGSSEGAAFILKLNGALTNLLASTYLGGSVSDEAVAYSIAIDPDGNIYVTGKAGLNFQTTNDAYDTSFNGEGDAFVSKLNGDLTDLLASTYLGGSHSDRGNSIVTDTSGNVYVTGLTMSTDFPATIGAHDTSKDGNSDAFVSKLSGDLKSLLASTYLGGDTTDRGYSIAIDSDKNICVTGWTEVNNADVFVSKLNGDLTNLLATKYLDGYYNDIGYSLAIDSNGNIYVTGETWSSDFPITEGAYDTSYDVTAANKFSDAFVSKFDSELSVSTPYTPIPTPPPASSPSPLPTLPPLPTPVPSPSLSKYGQISGYVYDMKGNPIETVMLKLKGVKIGYSKITYSDDYGFLNL